jgi:hypothetical protein
LTNTMARAPIIIIVFMTIPVHNIYTGMVKSNTTS